jgi:hypothetical protein
MYRFWPEAVLRVLQRLAFNPRSPFDKALVYQKSLR